MRSLRPRPGAVRNWVRRYPLTAMFAAGLLPTSISRASIWPTTSRDLDSMGKNVLDVLEDPVVTTVNGLAFAIGIGILLPLTWPVARAVARIHRDEALPTDHDQRGAAARWSSPITRPASTPSSG